jgi:hypothetical protein
MKKNLNYVKTKLSQNTVLSCISLLIYYIFLEYIQDINIYVDVMIANAKWSINTLFIHS